MPENVETAPLRDAQGNIINDPNSPPAVGPVVVNDSRVRDAQGNIVTDALVRDANGNVLNPQPATVKPVRDLPVSRKDAATAMDSQHGLIAILEKNLVEAKERLDVLINHHNRLPEPVVQPALLVPKIRDIGGNLYHQPKLAGTVDPNNPNAFAVPPAPEYDTAGNPVVRDASGNVVSRV